MVRVVWVDFPCEKEEVKAVSPVADTGDDIKIPPVDVGPKRVNLPLVMDFDEEEIVWVPDGFNREEEQGAVTANL